MSQTPPQGYLNRKIAESVQDAVAQYSADHIKTIVKAAMQRYIQSFMDTQGGNRTLFEALTKAGLQYVTDKSFDPASDESLRKTQLARLFEQIRQELPCILIMDSAFDYVNMNLNGMDKVWIKDGYWHGRLHIARNMKVMVVGGARDQSSADFLHGMLSVLFGEVRWVAGGTSITGNKTNGENWCMTMGTPVLGKVSQNKVSGDPKDTIWFFDIEVPDILFEAHVVIRQEIPRVLPGTDVMNPENGYLGLTPPKIIFPNSIPINEPTQLLIDLFQPQFQQIFISDPNVAVFDPTTRMITARRLGKFRIQILKARRDTDKDLFNQQGGRTLDVVAEKEVTVQAI